MSNGGVYPRRRKLTRRGIIPYDTRLVIPSRKLRKHQTEAEAVLWSVLHKKSLSGYKFTRQKPIDKFILDFYCSKLLLGIEVDGASHADKKEYDEQRTEILNYYGIKILRLQNGQILDSPNMLPKKLMKEIIIRENEVKKCA
jgi:very-short-patch-repair endonuclease